MPAIRGLLVGELVTVGQECLNVLVPAEVPDLVE
jgi:hypothetical protein